MADDEVWSAPNASGGPPTTGTGARTSLGEVFENTGLLMSRATGSLLGAYMLLGFAQLLLQVPGWFVENAVMQATDPDELMQIAYTSLPISCGQIVLGLLLGALSTGLGRTSRALLVEGPNAVDGTMDALRLSASRFLPVLAALFLYGVAVTGGLCLLLVGALVVGILLFEAPYLVAATDASIGDAFSRSYRLVTGNLGTVLAAFGLFILYALLLFGIGAAIGGVSTAIFGEIGQLYIGRILGGIAGVLLGYPLFIAYQALFVSLEIRDSGVAVAE